MQIRQCLQKASLVLKNSGIDSFKLDARVLMCHVLNCQNSYLFAHDDEELSSLQLQKFKVLIDKRSQNIPVAYLTGVKEFFGLDFKVTPATLIPRPDTETLVELVLNLNKNYHFQEILDLGTGSGAIIVALKKYLPNAHCIACDISSEALAVARENAKRNDTEITFLESSWFSNIKGKYNLIVSNPPYIKEFDAHLKNLKYEPQTALVAKENGLYDLKWIIKNARKFLLNSGFLVLEHGFDQALAIHEIFLEFGYHDVRTIKDLQGNDRVSYAMWG